MTGTWQNGCVVLDQQVDWPEGCRVSVEPSRGATFGIREEDWPSTPEALADWVKWYDSLEPLEMTPEEETALASWRQQVKERSIADLDKRLGGLFE